VLGRDRKAPDLRERSSLPGRTRCTCRTLDEVGYRRFFDVTGIRAPILPHDLALGGDFEKASVVTLPMRVLPLGKRCALEMKTEENDSRSGARYTRRGSLGPNGSVAGTI